MQWANTLFGQGLLDPEIEKRLTAQQKQRMGRGALMDAGLAMLAGSGWQSQPTTLGQGLAQGMQAGRASYAGQAQMMQEQQRQAQERAAAEARARAEAEYMASLPPEMRNMAQVLGVGAFAKSRADQENKLAIERERAKSKDSRTTLQKNLEAQGLTPGTPAYQQAMRTQLAKSTGTTVNVNSGAQGPFGKKGQELSAQAYFDLQSQAAGAQQGLASIDALESVFASRDTGKLAEAAGKLGQWIGTDAGADYQASEAIVQDRVFDIINSLKGPATDKDAERAQAQIPNMGTDPRARRVVFDYIRRKASAKVKNYQAATEYANDNQSLIGFMPPDPGSFAVSAPSSMGARFGEQAGGGLPSPQTQQDYDALPSGAEYINPDDGRRYRKP